MLKRRSLNIKILIAMIAVVVFMLIAVGIVFAVSMKRVTDTLTDSNEVMTATSAKKSSESMNQIIRDGLLGRVIDKAEIADRILFEFEQAVQNAATAAERIYQEKESMPAMAAPEPQHEDSNQPVPQILYSENTDLKDPEIQEEIGLVCNLQATLYSLFRNYESVG